MNIDVTDLTHDNAFNSLKYKCPFCGEEHLIGEGIIEDITGETLKKDLKISGRVATTTTTKALYHVRVCPKCAKKRERAKKIIPWVCHLIIPLLICILQSLKGFRLGTFVFSFIGLQFIMIWITWVLILIFLPKPSFEQAAKDNALVRPGSFF